MTHNLMQLLTLLRSRSLKIFSLRKLLIHLLQLQLLLEHLVGLLFAEYSFYLSLAFLLQ